MFHLINSPCCFSCSYSQILILAKNSCLETQLPNMPMTTLILQNKEHVCRGNNITCMWNLHCLLIFKLVVCIDWCLHWPRQRPGITPFRICFVTCVEHIKIVCTWTYGTLYCLLITSSHLEMSITVNLHHQNFWNTFFPCRALVWVMNEKNGEHKKCQGNCAIKNIWIEHHFFCGNFVRIWQITKILSNTMVTSESCIYFNLVRTMHDDDRWSGMTCEVQVLKFW
jgi:hypothetical protein